MELNFCDDILNLILGYTNNYYCIIVCKKWQNIILQNSKICDKCNKIIKMYDNILWRTYKNDNICHGYYGTPKENKIYMNLLEVDEECKFFQKIKRQSTGLCLYAIKHNILAIQFIKNPTYLLIDEIIKSYNININNLPDELEKLYLMAIKTNTYSLKYIPEKYKSENLCLEALKKSFWALAYVPEKYITYEMCIEATFMHPNSLEYVPEKYQTYELVKNIINKCNNPCIDILKHIKNQSEEICLMVVKRGGENTLKYVKNKTENICLAAVKSHSRAIKYIPEIYLTESFCLELVKENGNCILRIPKKLHTEEMWIEAVKNNLSVIHDIDNQYKTERVCTEALKNCSSDDLFEIIKIIDNLTEEQIINYLIK